MDYDLQLLREAVHYRCWIWSLVSPFIGFNVLDTGSGIGNYSDYLVSEERHVVFSDYDERYLTALKKKLSKTLNAEVIKLDLNAIDCASLNSLASRRFDTILCANVLEHIRDDSKCVSTLMHLLVPGGMFIAIVPAYPWLYSPIDAQYGHFRRYTKSDADRLACASNAYVERIRHFNFIGIIGWCICHKWLGWQKLSDGEVKTFDRFLPWLAALDRLGFDRAGLSILIVLRKPE